MNHAHAQPAAVTALGLGALLLAVPAWPQSAGAACDALPSDAEKLRCFRAIVSELESRLAEISEPAPAATPGSRREPTAEPAAEPAAAAATTPATPRPAAADDDEPLQGIEIVEIRQGPLGALTVRLANGEVWRQLDSDNTRLVLPDETTTRYAVIEEGFLGSRRMTITGTARSFRVRRID